MTAKRAGRWGLLSTMLMIIVVALAFWWTAPRLLDQAEGRHGAAGSAARGDAAGTAAAAPGPTRRPARSMSREGFEHAYTGRPPWDIAGPQPAFVALENAGEIQGSVLDVGCGTGEIALYLASRGHEVVGLDFVPVAIERAKAKARERGSNATFLVGDALKLDELGRSFDSAVDSGLFHTFGDADRSRYVAGLAHVVRPGGVFHLLCFSDQEPPGNGPRRVTQAEIRAAFHDGWTVETIRESRFQTTDSPGASSTGPAEPKAWLARIRRTAPLSASGS